MSILRNPNRDRYTIIHNALLEDERLSWGAKGLLAYLLSKPDGWEINQKHIENVGAAGRYKVRKLFAELYEHGYLEQRRIRSEKGFVIGSEVVLIESPSAENRNAVKPESRLTGMPENLRQVSTDTSVKTERSKNGWGDTPEGVDPTAWAEWADYKKGRPAKSTITKTANFLRDYEPHEQRQIVDQSIRNTWKGLFPLKENHRESATSSGSKFDDIRGELWREINSP